MLTNLQNLPAGVWVAAILVLVVATAIGIWLYRKFELKKVTVKTPVVEAELERRPADKPVNTALPTTADQPPPASISAVTRYGDGISCASAARGRMWKITWW